MLLPKRSCPPDSLARLLVTDSDNDLSGILLRRSGREASATRRPRKPGTPGTLRPGIRPEELLIGVSAYRLPADRNAILFQVGARRPAPATAPGWQGPQAPYEAPPSLTALLAAGVDAGLLTVSGTGPGRGAASTATWLFDPDLAAALHEELAATGRSADLARAHRRAAEYWQWRAAAWPQDRRADIRDLLEARHHLFRAGDAGAACAITRQVCAQLRTWCETEREVRLISSTVGQLPDRTVIRARWLHELGAVTAARGDHDDASRHYRESAAICRARGDHAGVARAEHSLGILAQAQGEYRRADRHYRRSAAAQRRASAAPPARTPGYRRGVG